MAGDLHQFMIGQLAGLVEAAEGFMSQVVPMQVDCPQVIPTLL
jgi:hypothetical protein